MIFLIQLFATLLMTGAIWFSQIIHYPMFANVSDLQAYEKRNIVRTGILVVPLMLVEAITAVWLLFIPSIWWIYFLIAALLLLVIWISTFALQAPLHRRIERGERVVTQLVLTNWLRTACWTIRSIILLIILNGSLQ